MEGDRRGLKLLQEDRREQVLSCVLLHVVEPPFPINLAFDRSSCGKRFAYEMPHNPLLILFHLFHGDFQYRSSEQTGIERLPAARRVEGSSVQRNLPDRIGLAACTLT